MLVDRQSQRVLIEAKRAKVLSWLKAEMFSSAPILGEMLGFGRAGTHKTLKDMERDDLLTQVEVEAGAGTMKIWGLTPHGSAMATDPDDEDPDWSYFEPGRVSPLSIGHALAVQRIRLALTAQGWTDWRSDRQCHKLALAKIPDALARDPDGLLVAVEVERTLKTAKRYQAIMAEYLQISSAGTIDRIQYICPKPGMASRLQRLLTSVEYVVVQSKRIALRPEHYEKFSFHDFSTSEGAANE